MTTHPIQSTQSAGIESIESLARRRARTKLGWYSHACIYLIVNCALIALSLTNGKHWAVYPLLGWGIGLLAHGVSVFVLVPGNQLVDRMTDRELVRLRSESSRGSN